MPGRGAHRADRARPVRPGPACADPVALVDLDSDPTPLAPRLRGLRVFAGYSGWDSGQLEGEIARGDWIVVPALPDDVLPPGRRPVGPRAAPAGHAAGAAGHLPGRRPARTDRPRVAATATGRRGEAGPRMGRSPSDPTRPPGPGRSRCGTTRARRGPSASTRRAVLRHAGCVVADTDRPGPGAGDQPPADLLPAAHRVQRGCLHRRRRTTFCEWKGAARYVDVVVPGAEPLREVGWWYPEPDARYPELADRVAVYAGPFDEVTPRRRGGAARSPAASTAAG